MTVWLLIHDDRWYDMGDMFVRGVYASAQLATAALPETRAYSTPHTVNCCGVEEWEVNDGTMAGQSEPTNDR